MANAVAHTAGNIPGGETELALHLCWTTGLTICSFSRGDDGKSRHHRHADARTPRNAP